MSKEKPHLPSSIGSSSSSSSSLGLKDWLVEMDYGISTDFSDNSGCSS